MRFNIALLALPALAAGQGFNLPTFEDAKVWYDKAQAFISSATSAPQHATSGKVADVLVTNLTWENWKPTLAHSREVPPNDAPEVWMVYITGGNRTCGGQCGRADGAWNESLPFFAADTNAPNLALLDCEAQEMLCGAWGAVNPSFWMYQVSRPRASRMPPVKTPLTIFPVNRTTVTADDIIRIHTNKLYLAMPAYEGALHPFDGWIATNGLTEPMAMFLYYTSKVPSWAFMIGLSFFSRYFVNKRMPRPAASGAAASS